MPIELIDSIPKVGVQLYLYVFNIRPNFTADYDENVAVFQDLLNSDQSFGILSAKKLPALGLMKFYQSFGEITCEIRHKPTLIKLSDKTNLEKLKRFHCNLFRYVLDIWKTFFVYDNKDSIVVVPTRNDLINWDVVESFQTWSEFRDQNVREREGKQYREEDWRHKVICPWYRADPSVRYIVTRVSSNDTPNSKFPNESYENYADYVTDKYPNVKVVQRNQFLIEVKGVTNHLNILHAGDGEDGRRKKTQRGQELLIPELCHNFNFPGDLWLKAICVPSILHRLTYLLHADHIRTSINSYLGIRVDNYIPKPVIDKMASTSREQIRPAIRQNPIIHPRPDDSKVKELTERDIIRVREKMNARYPEMHAPLDLERHFDRAFEIELDYYSQFTNEFGRLSMNDEESHSLLSPQRFQRQPLALLDVPSEEKSKINLLNIDMTSNTRRGVEQHEILAAITTASSGDVFHMELFEVLGDAFLKFSVSLYLLQKHPDWHEGHLTTIKGEKS